MSFYQTPLSQKGQFPCIYTFPLFLVSEIYVVTDGLAAATNELHRRGSQYRDFSTTTRNAGDCSASRSDRFIPRVNRTHWQCSWAGPDATTKGLVLLHAGSRIQFVHTTEQPTNSKKYRVPSEPGSSSDSQEIPHILWKPKVPDRVYKRTLPVRILGRPIQYSDISANEDNSFRDHIR